MGGESEFTLKGKERPYRIVVVPRRYLAPAVTGHSRPTLPGSSFDG